MGKLTRTAIVLTIAVFSALLVASIVVDGQYSLADVKKLWSHHFYPDSQNANTEQSFGRNFSRSNPESLGQKADPNYVLSFPSDHYSHDAFDIEWWYLTANLQDDKGENYGVQWTLFRFRDTEPTADSQWHNEHFYMAHASVHSESQHWFSEKLARADVGNAGIQQSPFRLFIDNWQWVNTFDSGDELSAATSENSAQGLLPAQLSFNAKLLSSEQDSHLNVKLNLSRSGPYVLQGNKGYSIKSADGQHASHYYSAPFIDVEGTFIKSDGQTKIDLTGKAWFDQEWTSQLFDQATLGWDWLSLHLDNGDKIMAFRMRLNGQNDYVTGTYINADGSSLPLLSSELSLAVSKHTLVGTKSLPLDWQLSIPRKSINIAISVTKDDQWNPALIAYYEGNVRVSGSHDGKGFLELTGY